MAGTRKPGVREASLWSLGDSNEGIDKGMLDTRGTREGQTPAPGECPWHCVGPSDNPIGRYHHSHSTEEEIEAERR